jgi:hypothetical protein
MIENKRQYYLQIIAFQSCNNSPPYIIYAGIQKFHPHDVCPVGASTIPYEWALGSVSNRCTEDTLITVQHKVDLFLERVVYFTTNSRLCIIRYIVDFPISSLSATSKTL